MSNQQMLRCNYTPLYDTLQYSLRLKESNDTIFIRSCQNYKYVSHTINDVSGCIRFEGYWYTPAFRSYIDSFYQYLPGEEDKVFSFSETFDEPLTASFHYQKCAPIHTATKQVKTLPFPYMYRPEDAPAEVLQDGKFHTEYLFPLEEGVWAEIAITKREAVDEWESMSTKSEISSVEQESDSNDSDEYGGTLCLTPTYMNTLYFNVLRIER